MKAKNITGKSFEPVTIEITFESQEELDGWAHLFNYTPIADSFEEFGIKSSLLCDISGGEHSKNWSDFKGKVEKHLSR